MGMKEIREAALCHFAAHGYEGASLSRIAAEVGIKKPSIYAHFRGKDDLFLHVLRYAFRLEAIRIIRYFSRARHDPLEVRLRDFFYWMEHEYQSSSTAKFLIRMSFFPPTPLHEDVIEIVNPSLLGMEKMLTRLIRQVRRQEPFTIEPEHVSVAYLTLLDGVIVELLYAGSASYHRRIDMSWPIFWRGIILSSKEN